MRRRCARSARRCGGSDGDCASRRGPACSPCMRSSPRARAAGWSPAARDSSDPTWSRRCCASARRSSASTTSRPAFRTTSTRSGARSGALCGSATGSSEADIADLDACREACAGVDIVLHEAALGSVPRSIEDPLRTHAANATGFLNMLVAARDAGVSRFVYAASSSTYGDHPGTAEGRGRRSGSRCRRTRSPSISTNCMRRSSTAATRRARSGCATSTCSAPGRIPRAPTLR